MIRKLTLAVGFGAGYVLGAKAGQERYQQIQAKFNELMGKPAVQDFTSNVTSTATAAADKAKSTVNEKVEAVGDKVSSSSDSGSGASGSASSGTSVDEVVVVDLGSTSPTVPPVTPPVTPKPGPGPVLGASASRTAPDVL